MLQKRGDRLSAVTCSVAAPCATHSRIDGKKAVALSQIVGKPQRDGPPQPEL